jgi:hypothetical protein
MVVGLIYWLVGSLRSFVYVFVPIYLCEAVIQDGHLDR